MLFAVAVTIATAAAWIFGVGIGGWVVQTGTDDCADDAICRLGVGIFGAVVGLFIGAVAYVIAAVVTVRVCRPDGERTVPTIAVLALPAAAALASHLTRALVAAI